MSIPTSIGLASCDNSRGRLADAIERLLLIYAEIMIRNGDVSRCEV